MDENKKLLLKNYLSNLQVNLIVANYIHCPATWRDIDYVPEYNKFYFICGGEGWLRIGGREYYPKPGQLFLMPAGVLQSYSVTGGDTFRKYWCHFQATIGDINLFDIIEPPHFIDVADRPKLEALFKELAANYASSELVSSLKVKAILLEIISFFIENTTIERIRMSTSTSVEKLNHVLDYIDRHLADNITVDELSRIVHFHPNYFIKFFKNRLGISPKHYINKMRLEKAKRLLITTGMPVTEIADCIGFGDLFHFSKAFKAFAGFSPSDFRNMHNI